ncbi:MAG: class I SAM-dependent methyltransferase [Candidatus Omnitrophica bacterium]|nr:class I SAM-dependent methyltransferase [Candidatus Omnitrophota bacterium]
MVKNCLISERYLDDGNSIISLTDFQNECIKKFNNDARIKYKELRKCPLCEYLNFTLIAKKDHYGFSVDTVVCDRCGLIFSLKQMTDESIAIFYSEYYRGIYEGTVKPQRQHYSEYLRHKKIPKFLGKDSVIVEIGTGAGRNLLKYKKNNLKHYGFDFDEEYIDFGKKTFGLNLYVGGIDRAQSLGIKADYIILTHVLEHTNDPIKFLTDIKRIMNDKAILNIYVPCRSLLLTGGGGTGFDLLGTLQNAHNFLFDEFTLKYMALAAGYRYSCVLGGHIVMSKNRFGIGNAGEIENMLKDRKRGNKVINFLIFCEKMVPLKNKIIPLRLRSHLHSLYYLFKPFEMLKMYLVFRRGMFLY